MSEANITTKFVTFYSYKGGVGRTSALVNTAIIRALEGNNVVILDFDLEAPGTSPYLKKLNRNFNEDSEGVLEYLDTVLRENYSPSLSAKASDLTPFLDGKNGGHLWAINAGNTKDKYYTTRLERLKWGEIFEKQYGELLLNNFKNQIVEEFGRPDYVLIDSRTGITETGGVCTRYLADVLVILTSLNEQNINGTATIFKELAKEGKETILVAANVPVGMPFAADELFCQRIESFIQAFSRHPDLFIYYYPTLSLSEELPALMLKSQASQDNHISSLYRTDPLLQSYNNLASTIDKNREEQISYIPLVKNASSELYRFAFTREEPSAINNLKQYYSDRLLAKIILDIYAFEKDCSESPPEKWDKVKHSKLTELAKGTSMSSINDLVGGIHLALYQFLLENIKSGGVMRKSYEDFVGRSWSSSIVQEEIFLNHFDWPIDFQQRALKTLSDDNPLTKATYLYNLSHCLLKTGRVEEAESNLRAFLKEFPRIAAVQHSADLRANYYFCAGLAYKQLHMGKQAELMRNKSEEQLALLKPDVAVFSPLDYKQTTIENFRNQLVTTLERSSKRSD